MKIKTNVTRLKIKGVNLNRAIKNLQKNDVQLSEIDRQDYKTLIINVETKNVKQVLRVLNNGGYNISIEKTYGFTKIFNFLKRRLGVAISLIIFISLLIFNGLIISRVDVFGCEKVNKNDVLSVLKNNGIYGGAFIKNVDIEKCEHILINDIDEISMISIIKNGTSIIVNVKEKSFNIESEQKQDFVAKYNGTVSEIEVVDGTALVKVGDSFKAGDVLIAGYYKNIDGKVVNCSANGKIKAKLWFSESETFLSESEEFVRTGKKIVCSKYLLFGKEINGNNKKNIFENFEQESAENYVFKNNFIPLKKQSTIFYETKKVNIKRNFEEHRSAILKKCYEKAKQKVPKGLIASNSFDIIEDVENGYVVSVYFEVETYL